MLDTKIAKHPKPGLATTSILFPSIFISLFPILFYLEAPDFLFFLSKNTLTSVCVAPSHSRTSLARCPGR